MKHFSHATHDSKEGATLAARVLRDGTLERVDQWTPLDDLYAKDPPEPGSEDEILTMTRGEYNAAMHKARLGGLLAFLRYVWFGSSNLWEAMKRLLAITRKTKPDFIRGMSATEVAWMLDETKAATSAREIRVVEGYLIKWGVLGFHGAGGSKSESARQKYSEVQKGNQNRKGKTSRSE